jgi:hypothetical protein
MTMIGLHYRNVVLAAAVTLLATLALPAQAASTPSQAEVSLGTVSVPACSRTETSRPRRPCQKVAAYAPMLFIGVGW